MAIFRNFFEKYISESILNMAVFGNFGKVYFEKYIKYGSLWKFWKSIFRKVY